MKLTSFLLLPLTLALLAPAGLPVTHAADGTGFTVLKNLSPTETGGYPQSGLIQGTDGALYGTTWSGGSDLYGTVFKLNPDGTGFTVLLNLDAYTTGCFPTAGLIQGRDGALYGTVFGDTANTGKVFKLNPDGTGFTVLKIFDGATTGGDPFAGLLQGRDRALYGTTNQGGNGGVGTVFKLNPDGTGFTVLKHLDSYTTGGNPFAGLLQGTDGALYGTTYSGGSNDHGTVFKLNSDGTGFTVLKNLDFTTGSGPNSGLLQGTDGALYGTAYSGGSNDYGTVFKLNPDGTNFTVLKIFDGATTGGRPYAGLMQGRDGALYGTTISGGSNEYGTLFKLNPDGTGFTVLVNFDYRSDGTGPIWSYAGLLQGTDGALYGTTQYGGAFSSGTVFRYTVPRTLTFGGGGFHQPVDNGGVINTVKNGHTVPIRFEVFEGSTELTDTSIVNQPLTATQAPCATGVPMDDIEIQAVGSTSLEYAGGQFTYKWQTPNKPGYCYVVTVTLVDGTSMSASFKLK